MRVRLAEHGRTLGTRALAARLLARIENEVRKSSDALVLIDLRDVTVFSHSFGTGLFAELIVRAQAGRYGPDRWIAFTGANEFSEETLEQVLKNAHLASLLVADDRSVRLIGEIEQRVLDTFLLIEGGRETTTAVLAKKLKASSLQAVNNWLAKLVTARVVDREQVGKGSGRPYVYRSRTPQLIGAGGR